MVDILDDGVIPANLGPFDYKGLYKVVCPYLDKIILSKNILFFTFDLTFRLWE